MAFGEISEAASEVGVGKDTEKNTGNTDRILESANKELGSDSEVRSGDSVNNEESTLLVDIANETLGQKPDFNMPQNDLRNSAKEVNKNTEGGRYGDIFKEGEGDKIEVHHMPADSTTELSKNDGPAIKMSKEDHRQTASCGNSKEAREYRSKQKELIENGNFREALQMDIDDIQEKFGTKYDEAISQLLDYVNKLEKDGRI